MSAEQTLITIRKQKHMELNGGLYPLANSAAYIRGVLDFMSNNPQPVSLDPNELSQTVSVHGRVLNFRKSGGISFINITDSTGSIQCIASKKSSPDYDKLRLIDLGDILELQGKLCLSKTNEKSILIEGWRVVTKSHRPPPEKFAGIADQELKYRKRYLDLMSSEETRATFIVRNHAIRSIRQFMEHNDFMEVETSTLNTISSGANAKPFTTHHNALDMEMYLRIAPELYLKRLLVGGYDKVYEIGRNYRNEGISTRHNPEFTMLEFYEAYGRFHHLIEYAQQMLKYIDNNIELSLSNNFALSYYQAWKKQRTFTLNTFKVLTMQEVVEQAMNKAGFVPIKNNEGRITLSVARYSDRQDKIGISALEHALSEANTDGERTAIYFEYLAEPFLAEDYRVFEGDKEYSIPVFITEYPVEICPLARPTNYNPQVCDRYELFIDGRELCNAFQELNDPDEQARKFKEQLESNNKDAMDYDADYVEALEYGMPPAIGFGMGIDRLVMLLTNATSIKDVILFPTLKPIKVNNA